MAAPENFFRVVIRNINYIKFNNKKLEYINITKYACKYIKFYNFILRVFIF